MIIDLILVITGIIGLIIASIVDLKKREIPDWLNYSLICTGLSLRLLHSLTYSEWYYFNYALLGFGFMFLIGNLMYYTKQWGGGDTKLLMALGAIFATSPKFLQLNLGQFPFLLILFINIIIVGAIYGILYSLFLAIKNKNKFLKEFKKLSKNQKTKSIKKFSLIFILIILVFSFAVENNLIKILFFATAILIITYTYLWTMIKAVENACMYKYISPKKLTEGDWVVKEIKIKGKLIYSSKSLGIEKNQIAQLIKSKIKKVLIKEGLPFVPSFLIGTLITLLFGNILLFIF